MSSRRCWNPRGASATSPTRSPTRPTSPCVWPARAPTTDGAARTPGRARSAARLANLGLGGAPRRRDAGRGRLRADVDVGPEDVGGVPLRLERGQPVVLLLAVGGEHPFGVGVVLEVDVGAFVRREGPQRRPCRTGPFPVGG